MPQLAVHSGASGNQRTAHAQIDSSEKRNPRPSAARDPAKRRRPSVRAQPTPNVLTDGELTSGRAWRPQRGFEARGHANSSSETHRLGQLLVTRTPEAGIACAASPIVTIEKYIRKVRRIRGSECSEPFPRSLRWLSARAHPRVISQTRSRAAGNRALRRRVGDATTARPYADPNLE